MSRRIFAFASVLLVASAAAAWTRAGSAPEVVFKAIMRPGGAFEGRTADLTVKETDASITVVVSLANLTTGKMPLRDTHMKEKYLEVAKFPEAQLEVQKSALKVPEAGKSLESDAKGAFTLHGVKKDITFHYKGSCDAADLCTVNGSFDINFNDFGVSVPSYLGVTVKPETSITATFQVKRDAAAPPAAPPAKP
jgi:polyisoprenoid-binding protein YceI